jgi:hypothetical protein
MQVDAFSKVHEATTSRLRTSSRIAKRFVSSARERLSAVKRQFWEDRLDLYREVGLSTAMHFDAKRASRACNNQKLDANSARVPVKAAPLADFSHSNNLDK